MLSKEEHQDSIDDQEERPINFPKVNEFLLEKF